MNKIITYLFLGFSCINAMQEDGNDTQAVQQQIASLHMLRIQEQINEMSRRYFDPNDIFNIITLQRHITYQGSYVQRHAPEKK